MASSGGSVSTNTSLPPEILLAKPRLMTSGKFNRSGVSGGAEEDSTSLRSRLPSVGSLNLLSDSWDFQIDRFLPHRNRRNRNRLGTVPEPSGGNRNRPVPDRKIKEPPVSVPVLIFFGTATPEYRNLIYIY
ncbi:hypothetical protein OROGR_010918 [Orobanche gracilis]